MLGAKKPTYCYYEQNRIPPAEVPARICELTGCNMTWLAMGKGSPYGPDKSGDPQLWKYRNANDDAQDVLNRLAVIINGDSKAFNVIRSITEWMEQAATAKHSKPRKAKTSN